MGQDDDQKSGYFLADFPKPFRLHNLQDWQYFQGRLINGCAAKLINKRGGILYPDIAESWETSPDGKEINFRLRQNATFSDDTPIDAAIAAFAFTRHIALQGQHAKSFRTVLLGGELIKSVDSKIPGIEIINKLHLRIHFKHPYPDFFSEISMLSFAIFKPMDVSSTSDEIHQDFAASGPYKIVSISPEKVVLGKNQNYWDKAMLARIPESITLANSRDQSIDTILNGNNDATRDPKASFDRQRLEKRGIQFVRSGLGQSYLFPDFKGRALSQHPHLVRLIHILFDRQEFLRSLQAKGNFSDKPIHAITAGIQILEDEFDADFAELALHREHHLAELGKITAQMRAENLLLTFAIRNSAQYHIDVGESIVSELRELGIPVEAKQLSLAEIARNEHFGEFDLALASESSDTASPSMALKFILNTNPKRTNIPADHEIFKIANRVAQNYEEHLEIMRAFNRVALRDGLLIPLYNSEVYLIFSPKFDISRVPLNDLVWYPQDLTVRNI